MEWDYPGINHSAFLTNKIIMRFTKLEITDWKQFEQLAVAFLGRLTVLTGANGSGNTAILHMLARN